MSEVVAGRSLASQALTNLVNQFARPLDFLRELVQNSLDAGTPRVEVAVAYEAATEGGEGVVAVHVDDFGEGMDEHIIDEQLTRLFSSTKEDDLTKIGKFGIGFTSIFAIRPDAVLVHTGRHGEFWELLFHADRTFEKVRVDKPVSGTRITLFKELRRDDLDRFVREVRYVLGYWCEHSDTPITFEDRTRGAVQQATAQAADPFAAFVDADRASGPESINRPFALELSDAQVSHRTDDVEIVVGVSDAPRYGFYNGGLTLVNSINHDILGAYQARLSHLAFKVRSNALEHTLTRDNVLHDAAWQGVMRQVVQVADRLRDEVLQQARAACEADRSMERWHTLLAREVAAAPGRPHPFQRALRDAALFRGHHGTLDLSTLERQERRLGRMLTHPGNGSLADALDESGLLLVRTTPATRALLQALEPPRVLGLLSTERHLIDARARFVLPELISMSELPADERRLIEKTDALLRTATAGRASLAMGSMGGPGVIEDLVVEGPRDGRLFERRGDGWMWLPTFLRWRTLLLNRHHPHLKALVAVSLDDADLAALALCQAVLTYEGLEGEPAYRRLFDAASTEALA